MLTYQVAESNGCHQHRRYLFEGHFAESEGRHESEKYNEERRDSGIENTVQEFESQSAALKGRLIVEPDCFPADSPAHVVRQLRQSQGVPRLERGDLRRQILFQQEV